MYQKHYLIPARFHEETLISRCARRATTNLQLAVATRRTHMHTHTVVITNYRAKYNKITNRRDRRQIAVSLPPTLLAAVTGDTRARRECRRG